MCHSFLLSLLLGVLLAKLAWRIRHRGCSGYGGAGSCGGAGWRGGWHGWRGHHGGPGPFGHFFGGRGQGFGGPPWAWAGRAPVRPMEELLRGLDLNQRQQEEAGPVLQTLAEAVGPAGPRLEFALSAV